MTTHQRPTVPLVLSALALAVVGALADRYAVTHHLPYAVGGHGRPDRVGADWPAHGTALGPPLAPFVVLALGGLLAIGRRWWGAAGDVLLLVVAAAEVFGTLAEPSFRQVFTPAGFDAAQAATRIATLVAALAVGGLAIADLLARWRARRASAHARARVAMG